MPKDELPRSPEILYEDKFCRLKKGQLDLKQYYFPFGEAKSVRPEEIRELYYAEQEGGFWRNAARFKGWGSGINPVWWACDVRRRNKNTKRWNIVLELGSGVKPGFTVVDARELLEHLRPMLKYDTIILNRMPHYV